MDATALKTLQTSYGKYEKSMATLSKNMRECAAAAETLMESLQSLGMDNIASLLQEHAGAKRKRDDDDEEGTTKKRSKSKSKADRDPNEPRKPPSGFLMFQIYLRQKLKESNPDIDHQTMREVCSRNWAEMPLEEKNKWLQKARDATAKWKTDKAEYEKKNGILPEEKKKRTPKSKKTEDSPADKKAKSKTPAAGKGKSPAKAPVEEVASPEVSASHASDSESSDSAPSLKTPSKVVVKTKKAVVQPVTVESSDSDSGDEVQNEIGGGEESGESSSEEETPPPPPKKTKKSREEPEKPKKKK